MTGTYKVRLRPDLAPCDLTRRQWGAFVATCRKLAAASASYSVRWELGGPSPNVVIVATGPALKPSAKAPKLARVTLPPRLTPQDYAKRAGEAQRDLLASVKAFARRQAAQWREGWSGGYCRWAYYWDQERQARCRKLGAALRVIHATGKRGRLMGDLRYLDPTKSDYQTLDLAMGFRVPRESELPAHERGSYFQALVRRYTGGNLGKRSKAPEAPDPKSDPISSERWYKLAMAPKPLLRQIEEARAEVEFWKECERLARERQGQSILDRITQDPLDCIT